MQTETKKMVTLSLSVDETNLLIAGLGELPLKTSAELWFKIREQAGQQLQPAPDEPVKAGLNAE